MVVEMVFAKGVAVIVRHWPHPDMGRVPCASSKSSRRGRSSDFLCVKASVYPNDDDDDDGCPYPFSSLRPS